MITYKFTVDKNNELNCYIMNKTVKKYTGKDAIRKLGHTKRFELLSAKSRVRNISNDKSVHNFEFYGKDFRVIFENAYNFKYCNDISIDKEINELLEVVKYNNAKKKKEKEKKKEKRQHFFQKIRSIACTACLAALVITTNETRKSVNDLKAQSIVNTYEDTNAKPKKGNVSSLIKNIFNDDLIIISDYKEESVDTSKNITDKDNLNTKLYLKTLVQDKQVTTAKVDEVSIPSDSLLSANEIEIIDERNETNDINEVVSDTNMNIENNEIIETNVFDSIENNDVQMSYIDNNTNLIPDNYMIEQDTTLLTKDFQMPYINNEIPSEFIDEQLFIGMDLNEAPANVYAPYWNGNVLNSYDGVVDCGPSGGKESFYDADSFNPVGMANVVQTMRDLGYDEINYPYYIREDGVRMLGNYVMVAANLEVHPRGSIVETTLGQGIVCDTGSFAKKNDKQLDIATNWTRHRW